jgi:hypothetical protein
MGCWSIYTSPVYLLVPIYTLGQDKQLGLSVLLKDTEKQNVTLHSASNHCAPCVLVSKSTFQRLDHCYFSLGWWVDLTECPVGAVKKENYSICFFTCDAYNEWM